MRLPFKSAPLKKGVLHGKSYLGLPFRSAPLKKGVDS